MPTIQDNIDAWNTHYDWSKDGDEWSEPWGGSDFLWLGGISPRIYSFVTVPRILEIAPGHGRMTHYLKDMCQEMVLVDLSENCIEFCRSRFADQNHLQYFVNDGYSLEMVPERIDFVFSYDSLVHAEADVMESYITYLGRKLSENGVGFIHHSNLGMYRNPSNGELFVENVHWRAASMTAALFVEMCDKAGLQCISQEMISWGKTGVASDCFSMFTRKGSVHARANEVMWDSPFNEQATALRKLSLLYRHGPHRS
jgi:SAM-dependent methyltransferase